MSRCKSFDVKVYGVEITRSPVTFDVMLSWFLGAVKERVVNEEARDYLDAFIYVSENGGVVKVGASKKQAVVNKEARFIAIFKERYARKHGVAYQQKITGKNFNMIKSLLPKLDEKAIDYKRYVDWFFDVFVENNAKFAPGNIGVAVSLFMLDEFFYAVKNELVARKVEIEVKAEKDALLDRSQDLRRNFPKDRELRDEIKAFKMGRYDNNSFRVFLASKTRKLKVRK